MLTFLHQFSRASRAYGEIFIPVVLVRWFTPYVTAQCPAKKLIRKRQVAELFGVSKHTIERWLQDGKLPEPERTVLGTRWDYDELVSRTRLKFSINGARAEPTGAKTINPPEV